MGFEMIILLVSAVLLFFLISGANMWSSTEALRSDIERLETRLRAVERGGRTPEVSPPKEALKQAPEMPAPEEQPQVASAPTPPPAEGSSGPAAVTEGFEFNFGKRLPVWIGGIALALSGFYLVRWTIEMNLLTDATRCVLGLLLGAAMIFGARHIRLHKPGMADAARIGQALSGAGIADLYASIFAATTLYHLVPPLLGFAGMIFVTALAVVLALRHGMPISLLGLLGGYLTPVLIQTDHPTAALLFSYLFLLTFGFYWVIAALSWWVLAIPVLVLAFLWVPGWLFLAGAPHLYFRPEDGLFLGLFAIAVALVVFVFSSKAGRTGKASDAACGKSLSWLAVGGAVALMTLVTSACDFALEDWGLYALLGAGCVAMAHFRYADYRLAPWLSMVGTLVLLACWHPASDLISALVQLGLAALYALGGFFLLRRRPTIENGGLLATAALSFYGLGYFTLKERLYTLLGTAPGDTLHLWSAAALLLALAFALLTAYIFTSLRADETLRDRLLALFTLVTTAFISIALTIEVHRDFLAVAFAGEVLAVCWVNLKVDIKALRTVAGIVFAVFGALIAEQLLLLCAVVVNSVLGLAPDLWHGHPPLATDPLFQLGLPMILTGLSACLVQRQRDGRLAEALEMAAVGLGALLLYYLTRNALHVPLDVLFTKPGFAERGLITNLFFGASLAVACAGRVFCRRALVWSGMALFAMALFRVVWFDFILANPLHAGQPVGEAFLFNALCLPYLLPVFWLWLEERPQLRLFTGTPLLRGILSLVLLFTFVSLNVRQAFHGAWLYLGATTNAEIYTYSAAWLVFGGLLLLLGTLRRDGMMRAASLAVMLLTVLKVFLYDASELQGLFRVFSFLGLGLSLLALSWFYSRFVFTRENEAKPGFTDIY